MRVEHSKRLAWDVSARDIAWLIFNGQRAKETGRIHRTRTIKPRPQSYELRAVLMIH